MLPPIVTRFLYDRVECACCYESLDGNDEGDDDAGHLRCSGDVGDSDDCTDEATLEAMRRYSVKVEPMTTTTTMMMMVVMMMTLLT